jgi:hypothetical protein
MAVLLNDYGEYRGNKEIYNVLWEGNTCPSGTGVREVVSI